MRTAYKVLAYLVAVEVAIQAMAVVWAVAGLGKWVDGGGVLDKAVMESEGTPFPEVFGFIVHGINGTFVIPGIALLLVGLSIGWTIGKQAAYYNCIERIKYDPALQHLCE